jgi:hypothetical protein
MSSDVLTLRKVNRFLGSGRMSCVFMMCVVVQLKISVPVQSLPFRTVPTEHPVRKCSSAPVSVTQTIEASGQLPSACESPVRVDLRNTTECMKVCIAARGGQRCGMRFTVKEVYTVLIVMWTCK